MKKSFCLLAVMPFVLMACGNNPGLFAKKVETQAPAAVVVNTPDDTVLRPKTRPSNLQSPPSGSQESNLTPQQASTVTDDQVAAAVDQTQKKETDKGTTIASLGLLERQGYWMKTPLVSSETPGRIIYEKNGRTINLTLIPNGAEEGAGSQLSLAAMQILEIPLTELATVRVFTQ